MNSVDVPPRAAPHRTTLTGATANGFGIYHDLVHSSGAATSRLGDGFEMTLTAFHFGRLTLFERQLVGADHRRDRPHIQRDGFGHYYLQVLRSGRMACGRPGEERRLAPGDAVLFDATQPMRTVIDDADYVTVILARDLVEAAAPNARRLHGLILPKVELGSIGETVLALFRRVPGFSDAAAAGCGQIIANLLGRIEGASEESFHGLAGESELELSRRMKAEVFIDANLGRDLDAVEIARRICVSRSSLYRAFQAVGGIEATVIKRRTARLRSLIARPDETRSVAVLAEHLGFSSASPCSRAFQQLYGRSPAQLRRILREDAHGGSHALHLDRMQHWYRTMNDRA